MEASLTNIRYQLPSLKAMGKVIRKSLLQGQDGKIPQLPSSDIQETLPPRPKGLVHQYIHYVGGDPKIYQGLIPFHMFPQWSVPILAKNMLNLPYDFTKILNAGCRIQVNGPLRLEEPLTLTARLEEVDDNGERAILTSRLITETPTSPNALVTYQTQIVPLAKKSKKEKKEPARVPHEAKLLDVQKLKKTAGLEFALLTGDFNPLHWLPLWAKASGFRSPILHGYASMARTLEVVLQKHLHGQIDQFRDIDIRFTYPLPIPGKAGVYVFEDKFYLGSANGGRAYLVGQYLQS